MNKKLVHIGSVFGSPQMYSAAHWVMGLDGKKSSRPILAKNFCKGIAHRITDQHLEKDILPGVPS